MWVAAVFGPGVVVPGGGVATPKSWDDPTPPDHAFLFGQTPKPEHLADANPQTNNRTSKLLPKTGNGNTELQQTHTHKPAASIC